MTSKALRISTLLPFVFACSIPAALAQTIHFTRAENPTNTNLDPNDPHLKSPFPNLAPGVVADVFGNGLLELLGTRNDGTGNLLSTRDSRVETMALDCPDSPDPSLCFVYSRNDPNDGRFTGSRPSEIRLADFDGDDCPDLIANGYSLSSQTLLNPDLPRTLLYFNDGTGRFIKDSVFANMNSPTGFVGRSEGLTVADFNNDGFLDILLPYYTYSPCNDNNSQSEFCPNSPQFYLLLNDGHGHFQEVATQALVNYSPTIMPTNAPHGGGGEGAQAVDINNDGLLDFYVAGRLMINQGADPLTGIPTFTDCNCGLPNPDSLTNNAGTGVDEGAKFLDWNNDGKLDLILHNWTSGSLPGIPGGPSLYENVGTAIAPYFCRKDRADTCFVQGTNSCQPTTCPGSPPSHPLFNSGSSGGFSDLSTTFIQSFGMNTYDMDNDGREDVITAASYFTASSCNPSYVFRNTGQEFTLVFEPGNCVPAPPPPPASPPPIPPHPFPQLYLAFGDIDGDGKIDLVGSTNIPTGLPKPNDSIPSAVVFLKNDSSCSESYCVSLWIEMLGPNGEHNQQGRVVQVVPQPSPLPSPLVTYTRVVDSGSGYHTQNQYPLIVGTRFNAPHQVSAYYPKSRYPGGDQCPNNVGNLTAVKFPMNPGQYARTFAPSVQNPCGLSQVYTPPPLPPIQPSKCMNWLQPSLSLISDQ